MRVLQTLLACTSVLLLTACAHPIVMSPDITKIEPSAGVKPLAKNVGYYIPADIREKEVTTPSGGGDSISYKPYKDIETALYKMLGNVFSKVTLLKTPNDAETIAKQSIAYVITPDIKTTSSSPSPFTWPPTKFTVDLNGEITDAAGNKVGKITVQGQGAAEFDEFKNDFSLSAKRAAQDALLKMQTMLLNMPELQKP